MIYCSNVACSTFNPFKTHLRAADTLCVFARARRRHLMWPQVLKVIVVVSFLPWRASESGSGRLWHCWAFRVDARVRTKVWTGFRKGLLRVISTPGLRVKTLVSHSLYLGWNKSQKGEGVFKVSLAPVPQCHGVSSLDLESVLFQIMLVFGRSTCRGTSFGRIRVEVKLTASRGICELLELFGVKPWDEKDSQVLHVSMSWGTLVVVKLEGLVLGPRLERGRGIKRWT